MEKAKYKFVDRRPSPLGDIYTWECRIPVSDKYEQVTVALCYVDWFWNLAGYTGFGSKHYDFGALPKAPETGRIKSS